MRLFSALLVLASFSCSPEAAPIPAASSSSAAESPSAQAQPSASAAPEAATPEVRDVVRVDPTTFAATPLGRVRFEGAPPYRAEVVDGGEPLRALVAEMNALDHVMSAGLAMPPQRVERSSRDFPRIMQNGWLKTQHHVELRLPPSELRPARRMDVWGVRDGRAALLGTVDVDTMDYLTVVAGPAEGRAALGKLVAERNQRAGESVDIPPPDGRRGKWGRMIGRGAPLHFAMMRDELLRSGTLLVPSGRQLPDTVTVEGPLSRFGDRRWLSVYVPAGLTVVPPTAGEHVHLEGPPGGPLAFRALAYANVSHDAAALRAHVQSTYGALPGFTDGEAGELEVGGRKLLAQTFRAGAGPGAAARLVALRPIVRHLHEEDETTDGGVALELTIGAGAGTPKVANFAAHPTLGLVLDSLFVDLESPR
jgi:hypothetical protein